MPGPGMANPWRVWAEPTSEFIGFDSAALQGWNMKKIAVCYKWVLNDADMRVNPANQELDASRCKYQINEYDRTGLETGVQIKAAAGGELVGLTCGTASEASAKDALSRGPDVVYSLDDAAMERADSGVTAKALAAMVKTVGDIDVVVCSEGSSDDYAQQVGPRLAALLDYPCVSYVSRVTVEGDTLHLERKLEDGTECVSIPAPVVITIVPDICEAPIPSVKQILGAKKKPANTLSLADAGLDAAAVTPRITVNSVKAPLTTRKAVRMNPDGTSLDDAAANLVKQLAADGVL